MQVPKSYRNENLGTLLVNGMKKLWSTKFANDRRTWNRKREEKGLEPWKHEELVAAYKEDKEHFERDWNLYQAVANEPMLQES